MELFCLKMDVRTSSPLGSRTAFTLIELLIVIAIILILISIALPNFLEAETRAKVTKAKGDMRSMALAIESYTVDWRRNPWAASLLDLDRPALPPLDPFETHLPAVLTTPNKYINELYPDPFTNSFAAGNDIERQAPYHYEEQETVKRLGDPIFIKQLVFVLFGQPRSALYYIFSHGPDNDHDEDLSCTDPKVSAYFYSPTNGTNSSGDIYYFGPGIGYN